MIQISYGNMIIVISILWLIVRTGTAWKQKTICWKREVQLLLVYVCLVVVSRFVFFPFSKVNGVIQPLVFDRTNAYPFRINLIPFIYLMDYESMGEVWLNLAGNVAMFVPIGVIWPYVFRRLDSHRKVFAAGIGVSACIEILQLPFYDRLTDIDDLLLNTLGYAVGYGLFLLAEKAVRHCRLRKAVARIQQMEQVFDELRERTNIDGSQNNSEILEKLRILTEYYENGQWMEDYRLEEQGELPLNLKRGVLSEDGIYNLLTDLEQEAI